MIADYEKEDYVKAFEVAPELVLTESDPLRFLRFTNFNAAAAAQRLVLYWKRRREVFGDRAFLPLTLTGDGALSDSDIDLIKSGTGVFLPNDADGCTVVCFDLSKRSDDSLERRLRCAFYCGQIFSENEKSQTDGIVVLAIWNEGRLIDPGTTHCRNVLLHTFPIILKAFHVIKFIPIWANNWLAQAFISGMLKICGYLFQGYKTYFHYSQNKEKIVQSLESHGISKRGLPRRIGGSWSYEGFSDWLIERARMDQERQPVKSFPATQTAPGETAALLTPTTTSDDDDCKSRSTEPSADDGLNIAPVVAFRTGGATSLVTTGDDDSKSRSIQPRDGVIREELYQNFRKQVMQAMEQLPQEEKASYIEALEKAPPQVWKEECNPNMFLRLEDSHAFFAAKRICRYWQLRSNTFGPKRFDSLYQTGENALETRELKVLQNCSIMLLPKDTEGCPVLSIDGSCLEKRRHWIKARDRCIFYMFSLLTENDMSQTKGAVLLYKMDSPPFHSLDITFLERLVGSLPLRFKAVHLLSNEPIPKDFESRLSFGDETYAHGGSSNDELASRLGEFGMNKAGLPKYLNGEWGLSKFIQWQEIRTRMEWKILLGFSGRDDSRSFELPAIRPYTLLPDEEKAERNRRLNVIHCRRKRDLKRVQVDTLEDECAKLRETRETLLEENHRLEDRVRVATAAVERAEQELGDTTIQSDDAYLLSVRGGPANSEGTAAPKKRRKHSSSMPTGGAISVHPVTAFEQASTANAGKSRLREPDHYNPEGETTRSEYPGSLLTAADGLLKLGSES
jgi:hypothetical protein